MSNNRLVINTADFIADLRKFAPELRDDAAEIVQDTATRAANTIRGVYAQHRVTGNLEKGVKILPQSSGPFGIHIRVRSGAPHAWLFDNGSAARHYVTASGAKHSTGKMWGRSAPTHAFVRTMIAARRVMWERLTALVRSKGFDVTGKAA